MKKLAEDEIKKTYSGPIVSQYDPVKVVQKQSQDPVTVHKTLYKEEVLQPVEREVIYSFEQPVVQKTKIVSPPPPAPKPVETPKETSRWWKPKGAQTEKLTEETIVTTTKETILKDSKGNIIKDEKLPPLVDKKDVTLV